MFNQNPFFQYNPGLGNNIGTGLIAAKKFNWGSLLTNTQKTLNVINQALPVYNQLKPVFNNAKTMFRVVSEFSKNAKSEFNKLSSENNNNVIIEQSNTNYNNTDNSPQFFA